MRVGNVGSWLVSLEVVTDEVAGVGLVGDALVRDKVRLEIVMIEKL
jgi:hypothetical protein